MRHFKQESNVINIVSQKENLTLLQRVDSKKRGPARQRRWHLGGKNRLEKPEEGGLIGPIDLFV